MQLRKQLRPDEPDWYNMSEAELEPYIIKGLKDELKTIKNICVHHNIDLTNSEGFVQGLLTFREKYCTDAMKLFYTDDIIDLLGELYDTHKDKL